MMEIQKSLLADKNKVSVIRVKFGTDNSGRADHTTTSDDCRVIAHSSGIPHDSWQGQVRWFEKMIREDGIISAFEVVLEGDNCLKNMTEREQKMYLNNGAEVCSYQYPDGTYKQGDGDEDYDYEEGEESDEDSGEDDKGALD